MATVLDVAKYILQKLGTLSTWKLQKLCYYAQAWEIAWTETPIFDEDFEAWANGPVCSLLFAAHKGKYIISENEFVHGNPDNLTEEQKNDIDIVLQDYGSMEPYDLRELSHSEDPWKDARANLPEGTRCNTIITKDSMGIYYGSL